MQSWPPLTSADGVDDLLGRHVIEVAVGGGQRGMAKLTLDDVGLQRREFSQQAHQVDSLQG